MGVSIRKVETFHVAVPYRYDRPANGGRSSVWPTIESVLVRLETDDGFEGWGESFGFMGCATTRRAIDTLIAPLCLGRDATDIPGLMGDLFRKLHLYGRSGPVLHGLSGIDIALWDIASQRARLPLYKLLAPSTAEVTQLPTYASLLRYGDVDTVARAAARAKAKGFTAIKLHEIGVAEVAAARGAIGPGITLMTDINCAWTCEEASQMATAFACSDLAWLEEPIWPPDDFDAMAQFVLAEAAMAQSAKRKPVPLAAGENAGSLEEFRRLIDIGKVAVVQPSVIKVGGISEMLRIITFARSRGVTVAPHSPYFGPGLAATVHLCAALLPQQQVEWYVCDLEARPFGGAIDGSNGHVMVPQAPGLGVGPDYHAIKQFQVN
jgi:L-alanine-DL-glutamate epimerase-like enolase superfamily enzyme